MTTAAYRDRHRAQGRCLHCPRPVTGFRTCLRCRLLVKAWRARRQRWPRMLCCQWWGVGPDALPWTCPTCLRVVRR
jgi:hypothetical protein